MLYIYKNLWWWHKWSWIENLFQEIWPFYTSYANKSSASILININSAITCTLKMQTNYKAVQIYLIKWLSEHVHLKIHCRFLLQHARESKISVILFWPVNFQKANNRALKHIKCIVWSTPPTPIDLIEEGWSLTLVKTPNIYMSLIIPYIY